MRALDAGADDYVTKPFSIGELLARLRAALRRGVAERHRPASLAFGASRLTCPGARPQERGIVDVTRQEYEVLGRSRGSRGGC